MKTKTCFKCGKRKPLAQFYAHNRMAGGRLNKCKTCCKVGEAVRRLTKRKEIAEYDRKRTQDPARKAYVAKQQRKHRSLNPDKYKARTAVSNALRDGRLKRKPCAECGTKKRVQAHHHDYKKPLEVTWLCFKCHREHAHGQTVN
jgi:hypothetical protein